MDDISDLNDHFNESRKSENVKPIYFYKLGEVVANGVRYFGQEKTIKGSKTAMCICPECDCLWRVELRYIRGGNTKHCGCKKRNK